ncbi:polysaccharide biosynthesis/export family protein [Granulosicoccus sp. 3-233]|uniref:polysaccharide biosynthesis/export family protein n=1 Tax=Granulosicoccus sp. 3-233 TaxID=3417969 RepID=UPI003D337271
MNRLHKLSALFLLLSMLQVSNSQAQSLDAAGTQVEQADLSAVGLLNEQQHQNALLSHDLPAPFGSNLFTGGFSDSREDGLNPGYVIQPGDRVSVRIWGAIEFNESLEVDPRGNIFLPSVGPIMVGGVKNKDLNARVSQAVGTVFIDNVKVYTSLDSSQPVAVFVTGNVIAPGRYAGIPSNSILYYIDKAGGIDPDKGSYRKIELLRAGRVIEKVDLYRFIRDGKLANVQFQDGDTILIKERGDAVSVSGDVVDTALFEMVGKQASGQEVMNMARLLPGVSYAGISGIRNNKPYSAYMPIAEFKNVTVSDGDLISFRADQHDSVIVVDVEGSHMGPSRFAVPRNTHLQELLDFIEVDPQLTDLKAISLKRQSVAMRQKEALQESLKRLEARYLTASSQTDEESAIRAQEAQLISQFVMNARQAEPSGRMVVARKGKIANILLQSGDTITIPGVSDSVLLSGEVLVSQAILFEKGLRALDYINRSGGFSQQALTNRLVVLHANGEVSSGKNPVILAGDEIIVLPKVPVKNLQLASTIVDILYKIAIAASVAVQL